MRLREAMATRWVLIRGRDIARTTRQLVRVVRIEGGIVPEGRPVSAPPGGREQSLIGGGAYRLYLAPLNM